MAANLKNRRGAQRGSLTRLGTRVGEVEDIADQPGTANHARQLLTKLKACEEEFNNWHFELLILLLKMMMKRLSVSKKFSSILCLA